MEISLHKFPVDQFGESIHILCSGIPIVHIVSMLPDVNGEEGLIPTSERIPSIGCVDDRNILSLLRQPCPAGAEVGDSLSGEILQELVNSAPSAVDSIQQLSRWLVFVGSHAVPVEGMIPMLSSIVEDLVVLAAMITQEVT